MYVLHLAGISVSYFNRFWYFLPGKEKKNDFRNEFEYKENHVMIPVNENISQADIHYIVDQMNKL